MDRAGVVSRTTLFYNHNFRLMKKRLFTLALLPLLFAGGVLFTSCDDDDNDGWMIYSPCITFKNVSEVEPFIQSGIFGSVAPGASTTFTFHAAKGQRLMLAAMYSYSNDLFFAPENPGIELFDNAGVPRTGVVADAVALWDNGTRQNEAPGAEILHPGAAQSGTVSRIEGIDEQGNSYVKASELMEVSLSFAPEQSLFTCTIRNLSAGTANETPFSSGVYAISNVLQDKLVEETPLFTRGEASSAPLTALAESGNVLPLAEWLEEQTGIFTTLNGALVVIYDGDQNPIYTLGSIDEGRGLASLAQKGDPKALADALRRLSFVRNVYYTSDVVLPGKSVECYYSAAPGDRITYALMFGYSNDWFFTSGPKLWALEGGDLTDQTLLLDAGVAVSQYPGAGNAQWLFDGTPIPEKQPIMQVGSTYPLPDLDELIEVTIR